MKYIVRDFNERYYTGLEHIPSLKPGVENQIPALWQTFMKKALPLLKKAELKNNFIGLECYPPDFMETKEFDYFALIETKYLIHNDGFVSKKLPQGKYISFEIEFDQIHNEIQSVYKYIKDHNVPVHYGFDYEEYLPEEEYQNKGAKLYFTLMLEHD